MRFLGEAYYVRGFALKPTRGHFWKSALLTPSKLFLWVNLNNIASADPMLQGFFAYFLSLKESRSCGVVAFP